LIRTLDKVLGRASFAWVVWVQGHALAVILGFGLATLGIAAYALTHLGLDSGEDSLFSEEVPYFALRREYYDAFPHLVDPIVVVIDAPTRDQADAMANLLTERLRQEPEHFPGAYAPGGGEFFERHGLLYLDEAELEELVEHLVSVQGYLAELSRDPSLTGLATLLAQAGEATASRDLAGLELADVYTRLEQALSAQLEGRPYQLSWADVILGESATRSDRRRYVLVQARIDVAQTTPADESLLRLRELVRELEPERSGVRVRATGVLALAYEEMERIGVQTTWAGLASFILVGLVLYAGLRSARLITAALSTLVVGLVWTAGFAALAIGHLNLVSVTFGVLFIGLSIDFAIHLCSRFTELMQTGEIPEQALPAAARDVGGALGLCAATTAVGFYAFVPTEYRGVAELGLIAGTGMFVSLFTNLTLLPALLTLGLRPPRGHRMGWSGAGISGLPARHPWLVLGAAGGLALGSLLLAPRAGFDPSPLRVRDPHTDSVQVFNEMLADGEAFPWNLNALAPDLASARRLAEQLERIPAVGYTVTLSDYVPENQNGRLEVLAEAEFLIGPTLRARPSAPPHSPDEARRALRELLTSLDAIQAAGSGEAVRAATSLHSTLVRFLARLEQEPERTPEMLDALETSLVGSLPERLRLLRTALGTRAVRLEDLPDEIVDQHVSPDGRVRVEIYPGVDLGDDAALAEYVAAVQGVVPDAFGEGYVILESGRAVTRALRQALVTAGLAIGLLLLLLWRSPQDAALAAIPLLLATLLTTAASVVFDTPFNFANVIVIPLLLGMGVDSGVHLVHRHRANASPHGNLLETGTARAVLFSSLTTIASFGTLAFSTHVGMASLGRLLTLGIAVIVACNLLVLPALVVLLARRRS
jgi:hopanoid biosynthesis associated RND transporter like protein HpnN